MKRILLLTILVMWAGFGFSQNMRSQAFSTFTGSGIAKSPDTMTNTDTTILYATRNDFSSWQDVSLSFSSLKVSGNPNYVIVVQGSLDATSPTSGTWTTLKNCSTCQTVGLVDTGITFNKTYIFNLANSYFPKIRVVFYQTGSGKGVASGTYWTYMHYFKDN